MSQFFISDSQRIGASASTSVLPMNIQNWFPLGWTGWISLQSKELSRGFSNTTFQKHQFFSAQLSLQSNSHIHTFSSVQSLSRVRLFVTPWTAACRPTCPLPTPGAYSNSYPLSRWCHPAISSFVVTFSSCPQSLPASESFPMSQLSSGGQSVGVSASASVLPMNIQDWFLLG